MLVLFDGWTSFFREAVVPWRIGMAQTLRERLETEVLPRFLEAQRWYAQKGEAAGRAKIRDHAVWSVGPVSWLVPLVEVKDSVYFLPLALAWEEEEEQIKRLSLATVARLRQQANVGVIADAMADEGFCRHVVKAIGERHELPTKAGALKFTPTSAYA